MDQAYIIHLASELLWLVLILSLPAVVVASVVGVAVGLVQALTQVQDQTVSFLIKLLATCITLAATIHWIGGELINYATRSFDLISQMGR